MNRDEATEALLLEVSRWQRVEAERIGFPFPLWHGKPVEEPVCRGIGPQPLAKGKTVND